MLITCPLLHRKNKIKVSHKVQIQFLQVVLKHLSVICIQTCLTRAHCPFSFQYFPISLWVECQCLYYQQPGVPRGLTNRKDNLGKWSYVNMSLNNFIRLPTVYVSFQVVFVVKTSTKIIQFLNYFLNYIYIYIKLHRYKN